MEGSGVIPLFAGFDPREEIGYHTFTSSVIHRATEPVAIAPVDQKVLRKVWGAGHRDGSNSFIYTRFLVPYLMGYQGFAIFADGADMICLGDIAELWALRDPYKAVQVVKHDYRTKHPRKYVGTRMESDNPDYPRKNWSSLMLINCAHYNWRKITPEAMTGSSGSFR
jgi:lipopolysaccharide biosynthesis glycosyltransferase